MSIRTDLALERAAIHGENTDGVTYSKVVDNSFASKGYQDWLKS